MRFFYTNILLFLIFPAFAQIINGPMPGYNTDTETEIWLQSKPFDADIQLKYRKKGSSEDMKATPVFHTEKSKAYSVKIPIQNLAPDTKYEYQVWLNGKLFPSADTLTFFTQPSGHTEYDFCMATGSCACLRDDNSLSPNKHYQSGSGYRIFKTIAKQKPDYMLWLGDNIYVRNGEERNAEGFNYRYTHTRSLPQMQPLLTCTQHFATWDDHDYGSNNGNMYADSKDIALESFQTFWANPATHPQAKKGLFYDYQIGDAVFFMTDDRTFRSPETQKDNKDKHFLGEEQLDWLLAGLENSKANFKFVAVGSQVLNTNTARVKEGYAKDYNTELQYLLAEIKRRKIEGVIFLSGDVHHTILNKMTSENFYPLYDITVSAFTSFQNPGIGVKNPWKVKGTLVFEHNFAMLRFSGKGADRQMQIEVRNKLGIKRWKKVIKATDLKVK